MGSLPMAVVVDSAMVALVTCLESTRTSWRDGGWACTPCAYSTSATQRVGIRAARGESVRWKRPWSSSLGSRRSWCGGEERRKRVGLHRRLVFDDKTTSPNSWGTGGSRPTHQHYVTLRGLSQRPILSITLAPVPTPARRAPPAINILIFTLECNACCLPHRVENESKPRNIVMNIYSQVFYMYTWTISCGLDAAISTYAYYCPPVPHRRQ